MQAPRRLRYGSLPQTSSSAAILVFAFAMLGGCASDGAATANDRYHLKLDANSALQRGKLDANPLLEAAIKFKAPDQFLNYKASYSLKPGDNLLQGETGAAPTVISTTTPVTLLGAESFGQAVSTQLPFLLATPLVIGAEDRYQGLLTPQGLSETRTAKLNWSPSPAKLGLQWHTLDTLAPLPFDCSLRGTIDVPGRSLSARADDTLKLAGGGCRVFAPDRGIANLDVNTWSAAWQWRRWAGDNAVQLNVVEPLRGGASLAANDTARNPGYELGASRSQTRGDLSAKASVAVRHAGSPDRGREQVGWSARTTVTQQFDAVAVSASLQHANDPLWFVPASQSDGNSVELGFDFRRWIQRQLATRKVGLGLTWSWIEPPIAGQPIDRRVLWNFSLTP